MPASSLYPLARRDKLVVEELQDELLVYDLERDQASCLNHTAAVVWKLADGKTSVSEMTKRLQAELGSTVSVDVVWYALDQLGKKNLLVEPAKLPVQYAGMTRRDFLVKAGLVSAAVAIPVIVAMAVPTTAQAATCSSCLCHADCSSCGVGRSQCSQGGNDCTNTVPGICGP